MFKPAEHQQRTTTQYGKCAGGEVKMTLFGQLSPGFISHFLIDKPYIPDLQHVRENRSLIPFLGDGRN
ncbi:Uncharacterized protein TCM_034645 [Theobroma cacao]|uniref:Uncharacterized protein n=1 Tax=Theobroma cacao TaxID=3641 RepID=A0A061FG45_THECC|nr:Uncharacterized protein TCM_034645 [Theobroma cacao]